MSLAFSPVPIHQQNGHAAHSAHYNHSHSMDRGSSEYTQSGLSSASSYSTYSNSRSENSSSSEPPASGYQQPSQEVRSTSNTTYSSSATPSSDYGAISSASRTPTFPPEYLGHRYSEGGAPRYHPSSSGGGGMLSNSPQHSAQPSLASSGQYQVKTNPKPSADSSVAAPSPTYSHPQYAYPPGHAMPETYPHAGAPPGWRPEWSAPNYAQPSPHQMAPSPYGAHASSPASVPAGSPGSVGSPSRPVNKPNRKRLPEAAQHPLSQVYSFVPIPGAQQHKRPRRRYEEIERMYKCGWNGCEKAYGTLNHLNAHVTMQSHGAKRTPEEFKEIRKEWKARKKEEEAQRKAAEEEARHRAQEASTTSTPNEGVQAQPAAATQYTSAIPQQRQLPPIGYQAGTVPAGVHYPAPPSTTGMDPMQQYQQPQMYGSYPQSPYAPPPPQTIYPPQRQAPVQNNAEETDADAEPDPDVTTAAPVYNQ
ncbi:hypothetical protein RUND412_000058 [Rhizina undulata]